MQESIEEMGDNIKIEQKRKKTHEKEYLFITLNIQEFTS